MSIIQPTDLKVYLSGGVSNTDPNASLGGKMSTTILGENLHDLFAKVKAPEALTGSKKYRAIFVKNEHATLTLEEALAYIKKQTAKRSPEDAQETLIKVGVAVEGKNKDIEAITDEDTAPDSVVFTDATVPASGEEIGDLEAGDYIGLWVERTISAGARAYGKDEAELGVIGGTTATE